MLWHSIVTAVDQSKCWGTDAISDGQLTVNSSMPMAKKGEVFAHQSHKYSLLVDQLIYIYVLYL